MSRQFVMRPAPKDPPPTELISYSLISSVVAMLDLPSASELFQVPTQLSNDQYTLGFLDGLVSANWNGAKQLVDAIRRHGTVEVWVE